MYVQSNKWAMGPAKLGQFLNNQLLPDEVKKYCTQITKNEVPQGLSNSNFSMHSFEGQQRSFAQYCTPMAYQTGLHYTEYQKAIYYDGHD